MKLTIAVDKRITELCDEHSITRYAISRLGGAKESTLSEIKNCKTTKLDTIWGICDALGITLKEFFDSPLFERDAIDD